MVGRVFTLLDECVSALRLAAVVQLLLIHQYKLLDWVILKPIWHVATFKEGQANLI